MRARFAFFAVAAMTTVLIACQLIVGVKDEDGVNRPTPPPDVGAPDVIDPCAKHHPPPPPSKDVVPDADTTTGAPVFFAVRTFTIRSKTKPPLGYDLDEHCTGDPTSTTSNSPCRESADAHDDDAGVDNTFGKAFGDGIPSLEDDPAGQLLNDNVNKGTFTLLVQISNYNGQANDDQVEVAVITVLRMNAACDGTTGGSMPVWDGCDTWFYLNGTPVVAGASRLGMAGYVSGGVLVARTAPDDVLKFGLGSATLNLHDAVLTARIEQGGGTPPTVLKDGVVAGRVLAPELLGFVNRIDFNDQALCENPTTAPLAKTFEQKTCAGRDLFEPSGQEARDGKEPPRCNALSFTIGFNAEPALLGDAAIDAPPLKCQDLDANCP